MNVPFAKSKSICDFSVGHIDGELFRDVSISGVVWKQKLDVLRQVSQESPELRIERLPSH
jgi:hypothetical protein